MDLGRIQILCFLGPSNSNPSPKSHAIQSDHKVSLESLPSYMHASTLLRWIDAQRSTEGIFEEVNSVSQKSNVIDTKYFTIFL